MAGSKAPRNQKEGKTLDGNHPYLLADLPTVVGHPSAVDSPLAASQVLVGGSPLVDPPKDMEAHYAVAHLRALAASGTDSETGGGGAVRSLNRGRL